MTDLLDWPGSDANRQTLRECRFVRRTFECYPSLRLIDTDDPSDVPGHTVTTAYTGQEYDPAKYELVDADWDHEHCLVCWHTINPGDKYWYDSERHVELCPPCHDKYLRFVGRLP